jgi:hypothetical protein
VTADAIQAALYLDVQLNFSSIDTKPFRSRHVGDCMLALLRGFIYLAYTLGQESLVSDNVHGFNLALHDFVVISLPPQGLQSHFLDTLVKRPSA